MKHQLKSLISEYFYLALDFIMDHINGMMDVFSASFLCSIYLQKFCNFNVHDVFGDIVYYIGGFLTLAWLTFRALSSIEEYKTKRNMRRYNKELLDEASKNNP